MNKETVEEAALNSIKTCESRYPNYYDGFEAGAEWQKEQSSTEAIDFMLFRDKHFHKFHDKWRLHTDFTQIFTIPQLYELYKQSML
jgi:hypothetical protein